MAESGSTMPPAVLPSDSSRSTTTRSPRGCSLTPSPAFFLALVAVAMGVFPPHVDGEIVCFVRDSRLPRPPNGGRTRGACQTWRTGRHVSPPQCNCRARACGELPSESRVSIYGEMPPHLADNRACQARQNVSIDATRICQIDSRPRQLRGANAEVSLGSSSSSAGSSTFSLRLGRPMFAKLRERQWSGRRCQGDELPENSWLESPSALAAIVLRILSVCRPETPNTGRIAYEGAPVFSVPALGHRECGKGKRVSARVTGQHQGTVHHEVGVP